MNHTFDWIRGMIGMTLLLLIGSLTLNAQNQYRNASEFDNSEPMAGLTELRTSQEIYLLWAEDNIFKNQILDYFPTQQANASILAGEATDVFAPSQIEAGGETNATTRAISLAADMDNNGLDEIVRVSTTSSFDLLLVVTEVESDLEVTGNSLTRQITTNVSQSARSQIELRAGNFDEDAGREIVIAWPVGTGGNMEGIEIRIFDLVDGKLEEIASHSINEALYSFDLVMSDLDISGIPEIVIASHQLGLTGVEVITRVLAYEGGSIMEKVTNTISAFDSGNEFTSDMTLALAQGDFDGDVAPEIAIAIRQAYPGENGHQIELSFLQAVDNMATPAESVFEELVLANRQVLVDTTYQAFFPAYKPVFIAAGDLNGDGKAESVVHSNSRDVAYYSQMDSLSLIDTKTVDLTSGQDDPIACFTRGGREIISLEAGDLNRDGVEELVLVYAEGCTEDIISDYMNGARLACDIFDLSSEQEALLTAYYKSEARTSYRGVLAASFVLGDFNGDNFRLGKGRYFKRSRISHPLIVLNAPPIHFDQIDGAPQDVNHCYNGQTCDFSATYFRSSTVSMKTSSTVSSAWSLSVEVEATATADAVVVKGSIEASVKGTYGEKFSKYKSSGKRLEISTEVSAIEDDQIYASVNDYDIWEYPVYEKDSLIGHLISVTPTVIENRWFPSKSFNAFDYLPDHEVGNVLSYRERKPDLSSVDRTISSDAFTLSANSSNKWTVNEQSFRESGSSFEQEISIEAKLKVEAEAQFKIYGGSLGVTVEGKYKEKSLSTQQTRVSEELEIEVDLGGVNESLGEVKYSVNPYCYWAKNGALVVDYTTTPEVPAPGASDTWWSANYGQKADPALILPWLHDPEKGLALQDEQVKRFQSKSVAFSNDEPEAGDTISIYVEVHNWSLVPTQNPVEIGLYLCDPTEESNRIASTNGGTVISSGSVVGPRGSALLSFDWKVPDGLPNFPRIYARVDPDNREDEIHEENNFGFNILNISTNRTPCPAPTITAIEELDDAVRTVQVFPNPVADELNIKFEALRHGSFKCRLFDAVGNLVVDGVQKGVTAGHSQERMRVGNLPAGIYYYQVVLNGRVISGKVLKL